ncbi:hypothetical protein [Rhizobium mesosinicum]|uniref:Uncharacterized protein n=1 Tax=Rhizobium mesosinicum TaxID=335017 RepID=A0ABS7GZ93_9HYPH|nr:hypothetical protein [Rhizobium mesosinicum]MBW9054927.1 hypothetical protein [Rhizobium mesosinicum]
MNMMHRGNNSSENTPQYVDDRIAVLVAAQTKLEKPQTTNEDVKEAVKVLLAETIAQLRHSIEY